MLATLLGRHSPLSEQDLRALGGLEPRGLEVRRGTSFLDLDDTLPDLPVIQDGWAMQYRQFEDGRRTILKLNLPGEMVDGCFPLRQRVQFAAQALTDMRLLLYPADALAELARDNSGIAFGLLWVEAVQHRFVRSRVMALATLSAYERVAHVCLELWARLAALGLVKDDSFALPVTNQTLGELLGMHEVHVSRMFRRLKDDGLVVRENATVRIVNLARLVRLVDFRAADVVEPSVLPDARSRPRQEERGFAPPGACEPI